MPRREKDGVVFSAAVLLCLFSSAVVSVRGDLPVHCLRHQIVGDWDFFLGPRSPHRSSCGHRSPDVGELQPPVPSSADSERVLRLTLSDPSLAQSATDDNGRWTMIYDEAFEVNVDGLSFLAFSRFDLSYSNGLQTNISRCGETQLGWFRDEAGAAWGCYWARRASVPPRVQASLLSFVPPWTTRTAQYDEVLGGDYHSSFAANLNLLQDLWTARPHERWQGKSLRQMNSLAGIFRPYAEQDPQRPETSPGRAKRDAAAAAAAAPGPGPRSGSLSFLQRKRSSGWSSAPPQEDGGGGASIDNIVVTPAPVSLALPRSWDWRDVGGANYLDPVLDQGECGSCYAVATSRMLSARHRIVQQDPSLEPFSISFPLYCSEYTQGCNGGYAFLLARWSQDVGLVPERCANYSSGDRCQLHCDVQQLRRRWRASNHHYVGGYYGAATEEEMMRELVTRGPLVASFSPKADIMYYSGGVYKSVPNQRSEWERVDHAVLLVGYGEERGQKHWILQNSWGKDWGEEGYFRMTRGTDESGIESIIVGADVVEATHPASSSLVEFAQSL